MESGFWVEKDVHCELQMRLPPHDCRTRKTTEQQRVLAPNPCSVWTQHPPLPVVCPSPATAPVSASPTQASLPCALPDSGACHTGMKFFTRRGGLDKADIKALLEGAAGRATGAALKLGEWGWWWVGKAMPGAFVFWHATPG